MYFSLYICFIQAPTLLGQFVQINAECDLYFSLDFSHSNISLQNIGREQLEFKIGPPAMLELSIAGDSVYTLLDKHTFNIIIQHFLKFAFVRNHMEINSQNLFILTIEVISLTFQIK